MLRPTHMHIKTILSIAVLLVQWLPGPSVVRAAPIIPAWQMPTALAKTLTPIETSTLSKLELAPFPFAAEGTYPQAYDFGNCTAYVAGRKAVPQNWGNANTWDDYAAAAGLTVSYDPVVGTIAQSDGGYYGHVAIVLSVEDGQVLVTEMNVQGLNVVSESRYPTSHFRYIYI